MRLVVDASAAILAAQSSAADPRAEVARQVLPLAAERWPLAAPALLKWEVANIVHRKRAAEWTDAATRARVVEHVLAGIEFDDPDPAAIARAGSLVERLKITAYDAAYVELAARDDASLFLTEDDALRAAADKVVGKKRTLTLAGLRRLLD